MVLKLIGQFIVKCYTLDRDFVEKSELKKVEKRRLSQF